MHCFIAVGDIHLRLTPPRRRIDSMFEAQLKKLEWIGQKASELNCLFVIFLGDVGDAWDWKISMINRVADTFKKFPCPIYTIIGNHDVPGRNPELWKDTGIGLLHSMGAIKILLEPKVIGNFHLTPFHSDAKDTDTLVEGKYSNPDLLSVSNTKVAIVHAPVGAEATPWCKGHKELFINTFDIALFGDIHDGWTPYDSITGCKLCNPGSLTRLKKNDIDRIPKILVIDENKTIKELEVPCTLAKDCFDYQAIEHEKDEIGKGFLAALAAQSITNNSDPKIYVQTIGTSAGYKKEAIDLLVKEIIL